MAFAEADAVFVLGGENGGGGGIGSAQIANSDFRREAGAAVGR
jgi:hypothetical protein